MQDRYVGDIGDFGKYALLKALAGDTLRLAVIWCLNAFPEANFDGNITAYSHLAGCDRELYENLRLLVHGKRRSVKEIQRIGILKNACFFEAPVPRPEFPCLSPLQRNAQQEIRKVWANCALRASAQANIVFLDPDNGIAGPKHFKHQKRSVKYVFNDEVEALLSRGQSVILYQHRQRKPIHIQVSEQLFSLSKANKQAFVIRFNPGRLYYVLAAKNVGDTLRQRAADFCSGAWGCCFQLISKEDFAQPTDTNLSG